MKKSVRLLVVLIAIAAACRARAQSVVDGSGWRALRQQFSLAQPPPGVRVQRDVSYAETTNPRQMLDLLLPENASTSQPLPIIVFIHGGGWRNGDKRMAWRRLTRFVQTGNYAAASINYRLIDEATWPAQIHDCKAAIRWIRGNAARYNVDPSRIAVMGTSAGGHLVAVLGTTAGNPEIDGSLGTHRNQSAAVTCVIDECGPSDLRYAADMGARFANRPEPQLLGTGPDQKRNAVTASPVVYASKGDPPFLIIHGTSDAVVPIWQSEVLHDALTTAGVQSLLIAVNGGGHGAQPVSDVERTTDAFLAKHLLGKPTEVQLSGRMAVDTRRSRPDAKAQPGS